MRAIALVVGVLLSSLACSDTTATRGDTTETERAITTKTAPPAKPASKWRRSSTVSKMDDSRGVVFSLDAEAPISGWLKVATPTLMLRCQENRTQAFIVTKMAANVEYGETGRHTVQIRFNDGRAEKQMWTSSTDHEALFAPSAIAFARRVAKSDRLRVQFTPFNASPQIMEFDIRGGQEHVQELAATCKWSP